MQKPLNLSKFLPAFATGNLDDGRLKLQINFAYKTPLNPDFVLKCLQVSTQPTSDATFQPHRRIMGLRGLPHASEELKPILPMFLHPNPLLFYAASLLALPQGKMAKSPSTLMFSSSFP